MDVTRLDSQRLKDVTTDNPVHTLTRSEEDVLGRYEMRGGSTRLKDATSAVCIVSSYGRAFHS